MPIQTVGSAPEIGQSKLPKLVPISPVPTVGDVKIEGPKTTFVLPPPTSHSGTSDLADVPVTPPEASELEILPDAEIDAMCDRHIQKVDRRWSRATKIMKLLEAGINKAEVVEPPPPPPTA